ncbi:hypothetical protein ACFRFU_11000 [Streptomyces sp. NPDC056704]|uniref:hypothetical protein n=1 Tax=Streptomyces sp. NPDC056704 TaxID=3345917 RepID=UPI003682E830
MMAVQAEVSRWVTERRNSMIARPCACPPPGVFHHAYPRELLVVAVLPFGPGKPVAEAIAVAAVVVAVGAAVSITAAVPVAVVSGIVIAIPEAIPVAPAVLTLI